MAFLDTDRGHLIIRIVFDGPPRAGKTTTVRSLAENLGVSVASPEETLGRTLYFDWLEYTGGLWNGHQIRCQVITVPGQTALGARRFELLRLADCIVYVFDGSEAQLSNSLAALGELESALTAFPEPSPQVLLQLNKRDLPEALPRKRIDAVLPASYTNVKETIATDSAEIRSLFVSAVRLALVRVEQLQLEGALPLCRPHLRKSEDLLASLKSFEEGRRPTIAKTVPLEATAWYFLRDLAHPSNQSSAMTSHEGPTDASTQVIELANFSSSAPSPPVADIPSGGVWPPARGRLNLEIFCELPCTIEQRVDGDWEVRFGFNWKGLSHREHVFDSFAEGQQRLLELTRLATDTQDWLSPERSLVLSPTSNEVISGATDTRDRWRLWEVLLEIPPLETLVRHRLPAKPKVAMAALVQIFRLFEKSTNSWPGAQLQRPLSPAWSGLHQNRLVYTGFLTEAPQEELSRDDEDLSRDELQNLAFSYLEAQGIEIEQAVAELQLIQESQPELRGMAAHLEQLLAANPALRDADFQFPAPS